MAPLDDLGRTFFDGLYTNRIPVAIAVSAVALVVDRRRMACRLVPGRATPPVPRRELLVVVLIVGLPLGYYLASPIWIRTVLVEPGPIAAAPAVAPVTPVPTANASPTSVTGVGPASPPPVASEAPTPVATPFAARRIASGPFHGTDDFHFGAGTATIVETAPGSYVLRLEDFSVRNGPDLYVYLSPAVDDYARGRARARPAQGHRRCLRVRAARRHRPRRFRQRDHLVQAVLAPVRGRAIGRHLTHVHGRKSGLGNAKTSAYHPA